MRRVFASFLAASIILLATTFAGMALFGMGAGMGMDHGTCAGADCHSMPHETSGTECLSHCLSLLPNSTPTLSFSLLASFVLALALVLVSGRLDAGTRLAPKLRRWREGIGKILLRQKLATVILRD